MMKRLKKLDEVLSECDGWREDIVDRHVLRYGEEKAIIVSSMVHLFGEEYDFSKCYIRLDNWNVIYKWKTVINNYIYYFMDEWFEKEFEIEPLDERLFEI